MIERYYIAWDQHSIFTSREELIEEYMRVRFDRGNFSDWADVYLEDHYSSYELFSMTEGEKDAVRTNMEDELWDEVVRDWAVDVLEISSNSPVSIELEGL